MICLENIVEFVPFGRKVSDNHPARPDENRAADAEGWHVGPESKDELYYKGSTVVWSSGGQIKKCLTIYEDVRDVMRCRFYTSPDRPCVLPLAVNQDPVGEPIQTICVRNCDNIRIFCDSGDEYKVHLQFGVLRSWRSKYGIILERQVLEKEKPRPVVFCLLHPLDDFTRVIWKQGVKIAELTDQSQQIVYTDEDPSIVITYNSVTDLHSVWRIRRAFAEEAEAFRNMPDSGYTTPYTGPNTPFHGSSAPFTCTPNNSNKIGSASPSLVHTPVGSKTSRQPSGFSTPANSHPSSPGTRPGSPASRLHSPQSIGAILRSGVSPSFSSKVSARLGESPSRRRMNLTDDEGGEAHPHPVEVTVCFEHIWSETPHPQRQSGTARKVFKSVDSVGQSYYCLLLPNNTLSLIKYKFANDDSGTLIFGAEDRIPAVDAVPVPDLNMIMVLDPGGSLSLFSGASRVGKAILPPSSTALLSQEISALALDSKPTTPFPPGMECFPSTPQNAFPPSNPQASFSPFTPQNAFTPSTPQTGFPPTPHHIFTPHSSTPQPSSISTPITKATHPGGGLFNFPPPSGTKSQFNPPGCLGSNLSAPGGSKFGSSFTLVSPVTTDLSAASLTGLRDSIGRQVTLVYNTRHMLRVTLPKLSTALVEKGLEAVKQLLPRDLAQQLHGSWYSKRHAPGPTLNLAAEWDMFCKCILGMSGYQVDYLDLSTSDDLSSGCPGPKRSRTEIGTDGDWQYLLDSPQHTQSGHSISKILRLDHVTREAGEPKTEMEEGAINPACPLFSYIPGVFWSLHLVYEERKLDTAGYDDLRFLANLLSRLAADLRLVEYQHHYWKDFPENSLTGLGCSQLTPDLLARLNTSYIPSSPPCIHSHLTQIQTHQVVTPFPVIIPLNHDIRLVTSCLAALNSNSTTHTSINIQAYLRPLNQPGRPTIQLPPLVVGSNPAHTVAELIAAAGWDRVRLLNLPASVLVPITAALAAAQLDPNPTWGQNILRLIGREDLAMNHAAGSRRGGATAALRVTEESTDGLEGLQSDLTKLRWPKDLRVVEARRILQSCKPVVVSIEQGPEVSDHDFVEEQEYFLKRMCERTMALPVGRGIAALRTTATLPTETLSVPKLCLTGKAPPRGTRVELTHIDYSQNMDHWPSFHNGVAAGLRLCADPASAEIDSTWISFNKPAGVEASAETEHAGFLMALGLNGHLSKLSKLDAFDYLSKGTEPISIGLLMGVAASHIGSMDVMVTKKLATQLEALLPPTATELPLSHNTQVAALMGVGLLYANSGHRHMVEVCLKELGKPPGPELENCVDRESYSLTAGLALGLITMGRGESLVVGSLADLNLTDVLHNHMLGGPRPPANSSSREKQQSYQIKEGDNINIDITSPGATLALGMLFWRSGNKNIASWLTAPNTIFLLDFVRPDFLMLRTLAKGLILWDDIQATVAWIESHVPSGMLPHCLVRPPDNPTPGLENLDYETLNQAYCNIISGAAFVLGLRFAGSWNPAAFNTLEHLLKKLIAVSKRSIAELTGKAVIEQTICLLVLSQALVMAGSGDLNVLRTCRYLRSRVHTSTIVNYGSHMAVHMAAGLLFLGGGKYGLASTPLAVASLIIAFFPKFPTHSNDNRYHLQAFRHLFVLAVEPRLIIPRCSKTGDIVPVKMNLRYSENTCSDVLVTAPILLPSLETLSDICTDDQRYWRIRFNKDDGWVVVRGMLEGGGNLVVKRTGTMRSKGFQWSISEEDRSRLQENTLCSNLLNIFLKDTPADWRLERESLVSSCVSKDQEDMVPVLSSLLSLVSQLSLHRVGLVAHQLRSILATRRSETLDIEPELIVSLLQKINSAVDAHCAKSGNLTQNLRNYFVGSSPSSLNHSDRQMLSSIVTINSIPVVQPSGANLNSGGAGLNHERDLLNPATALAQPVQVQSNPLKLMNKLKKSPNPAAIFRVLHPVS